MTPKARLIRSIRRIRRFLSRFHHARFVTHAAGVSLVFGLLYLLGFGWFADALSGEATTPFPLLPFGALYALFHLLFVLVVPILLLAAAFGKALRLLWNLL